MRVYKFDLNSKDFGRIGCVADFYKKVGVDFGRMRYDQFRINPSDAAAVFNIIKLTNEKFEIKLTSVGDSVSGLKVEYLKKTVYPLEERLKRASWDWFNYSPVEDSNVGVGELWVYEKDEM